MLCRAACRFHGLPPAVSLPLCLPCLLRFAQSSGQLSRCRHACTLPPTIARYGP